MCAKYFFQIHLFGEMIAELAIYYVNMTNTTVAYASRTISTKQCHKNSISKSQNGPLTSNFVPIFSHDERLCWRILDMLATVFSY